MTLVEFVERHRVIEFAGIALEGEVSDRKCDCCGETPKEHRYEFTVDSGQANSFLRGFGRARPPSSR